MNAEIIKNPVTLESLAISIGSIAESILLTSESLSKSINSVSERVDKLSVRVDGLAKKVDDLPTRKEFISLEKRLGEKIDIVEVRLEKQIDDLAISVHNEFERVHIRLDDMDTHLVSLKNNDLKLEKRVRRLEGAVFA